MSAVQVMTPMKLTITTYFAFFSESYHYLELISAFNIFNFKDSTVRVSFNLLNSWSRLRSIFVFDLFNDEGMTLHILK